MVNASLVAGAAVVAPDSRFPLGVLLRIEPGWHVFWLNPGDAGLATSVRFIVPIGFTVGALNWPTPAPFKQAGNVRGYGYEGEVLLAAPVQAPAELEPGRPVRLRAEVAWLACRTTCVPGRASLDAPLPVAERGEPANADLFAAWQERLPLAEDAPDIPFSVRRTGLLGGPLEIVLAWRGAAPKQIDWLPTADPMVEVGPETITSEASVTRIAVRTRIVTGQRPAEGRLRSLVTWIDAAGRRRGVWLSVPSD